MARLTAAMEEMAAARPRRSGPHGADPGPDEYLFGEEKALLEVIEGNEPLPGIVPAVDGRAVPPARARPNPTVVNNVETLANVPLILDARSGVVPFDSGRRTRPGTMLFTLSGDVRYPGVYELPARILAP